MIEVKLEIHGLKELQALMQRYPQIAGEEMVRSMNQALVVTQAAATERAPVGVSGDLRRSINFEIRNAVGANIVGAVGPSVEYGAPVEYGSVPHYPPLAPLVLWVERKLQVSDDKVMGVARAIQHKIGRSGTKEKPYMRPAWEAVKDRVNELFAEAGKRIAERIRTG